MAEINPLDRRGRFGLCFAASDTRQPTNGAALLSCDEIACAVAPAQLGAAERALVQANVQIARLTADLVEARRDRDRYRAGCISELASTAALRDEIVCVNRGLYRRLMAELEGLRGAARVHHISTLAPNPPHSGAALARALTFTPGT